MAYDIEKVLSAYVECALWSTTDESGHPLDDNFSREDISPHTLAEMRKDCEDFIAAIQMPWSPSEDSTLDDEQLGHDFWLTRCGHGTGFWDRDDLAEGQGDRLTEIAEKFGEEYLYVGDNGDIYN